MPSWIRSELCWLAPTCLGAMLAAQVATGAPAQGRSHSTRWSTREGLPQNSVVRLCQARDGRLWIGTFGGLARFDGHAFTVFDVANTRALPGNRINALYESADRTVWIGTIGGGAVRWHDGEFLPVRLPMDGVSVPAFVDGTDGRVWLATSRGVCSYQDGTATAVAELGNVPVADLLRRPTGEVLAAAESGLWQLAPGPVHRLHPMPIGRLAVLRDGTLVASGPSRLWLWRPGDPNPVPGPWMAGDHLPHAIAVDADGSLWVGADAGLFRIPAEELLRDGEAAAVKRIGLEPRILSLLPDREGNLWIGTGMQGLQLQRTPDMTGWSLGNGLPTQPGTTLLADGEDILLGCGGGLLRHRHGRFDFDADVARHGLDWITALARDDDGAVWFGHRAGLGCLAHGDVRTWGADDGLPTGQIRAICRDGDGTIWLGTDDGPWRFVGGRAQPFAGVPALNGQGLTVITNGPDGRLWLGGSVLARLDRTRTAARVWRCGHELPAADVRGILPDDDGDDAWIATYGGGMCRVGDRPTAQVDRRHGLHSNSLCAATWHGDRLWCNSNDGVFWLRRDELDEVARGHAERISCQALVPASILHAEGNGGLQPAHAIDHTGRLWFCTVHGPIALDPGAIEHRQPPPECVLEHVEHGGRILPANTLHVADGEPRAPTIAFTACAFARPEPLTFRWRIRELDPSWSPPTLARQVRCPELPPGEHTFEVVAAGADGRWSPVPAKLPIRVQRTLVEQPWFHATKVLLVLAGLAAVMRFASRRSLRRASQLARQIAERTADLRNEIAERKRVETVLRTTQRDLEHRVRERTRRLQDALARLRDDAMQRDRTEKQLQRMQRMQSIGSLAGGVAHDFNNLLTVVLGCSSLLAATATDPDAAELARSIHDAGERGRRLTQHLLTFASRRVVPTTVFDLGVVIADLLTMLRRLLGESVVLDWRPPPQPVFVAAAQVQIEQILVNLCVNAREAILGNGTIRIELTPNPDGAMATLTVADTGTGMPPEVRDRAFEPFFTTKAHRNGSGMGLASVYGIVQQLGGAIEIDSEVGAGTRVTIRLPRSAEPREAATVAIDPVCQRGGGTVLLVDDEAGVRIALARVLTSAGFEVITAQDGEAAVERLREEPAIDVVLSDVVMPGLRDRHLVAALRAVRPTVPIVFMTGYLDRESLVGDLAADGFEVLDKPPVPGRLTATLLRAIGPRAPQPAS